MIVEFIFHGKFTCLADVDSNSINFDKLPLVDLYCSHMLEVLQHIQLCSIITATR